MNKTNIDWPELSYSWNPIVGCANVCPYCYARKISNRFGIPGAFETPKYYPERLEDPLKVKKASTIFVGSMCDIFSAGVNDEWIHNIISVAIAAPWHKFMFLTKKPERYQEFRWPYNCWLGTTIEKFHPVLFQSRVDPMKFNTKNLNKKFISIEPILGDFSGVQLYWADLIIIGADSSRGAKVPPLEWIRSVKHHNIWYKENLRKHYPELINE